MLFLSTLVLLLTFMSCSALSKVCTEIKPEARKFLLGSGFIDIIDVYLEGICAIRSVANSNSSITHTLLVDDLRKQHFTALNQLSEDEQASIARECKGKVPIVSNLMRAVVHALRNCPEDLHGNDGHLLATRKLEDEYSCIAPCCYDDDWFCKPSPGISCGTCVNSCSVISAGECVGECTEAITYCTDPFDPECYTHIFSCFNDAEGCCVCGAYYQYYSCGCCGYPN